MVNTFIISEYLPDTFTILDNKRLGKQRLEAKQIINILEKIDNGEDVLKIGFASHPATKMWIGYTDALKIYYNLCVTAWINRGFKNTMPLYQINHNVNYPKFLSFLPLINSHKAALIRKDPIFYKHLKTEDIEPYMKLGYLWPNTSNDDMYINWDFKFLSPMGSGVPPQYRITREIIEKWITNKNKNPITNRNIKQTSKIYKEYETVAKFHKLI